MYCLPVCREPNRTPAWSYPGVGECSGTYSLFLNRNFLKFSNRNQANQTQNQPEIVQTLTNNLTNMTVHIFPISPPAATMQPGYQAYQRWRTRGGENRIDSNFIILVQKWRCISLVFNPQVSHGEFWQKLQMKSWNICERALQWSLKLQKIRRPWTIMQVSMFRRRGGGGGVGKGAAFEFFCIFWVKFQTLGTGK